MAPETRPLAHVVGVDPSNVATGLALVRDALRLEDRLAALVPVTGIAGELGVLRTVRERIHPQLHRWHADHGRSLKVIAVEEAPPTARADVDHGPQAAIGWAQGWLGGLIVGPFVGAVPILRADASDWRTHLLVEAARAGLVLEAPGRRRLRPPSVVTALQRFKVALRSGGGWSRTWEPCGHVDELADYEAVSRAPMDACPTCARGPQREPGMTDAEAIRDAWKALACRVVAHFWPVLYTELVRQAQARSRTNPPDHRLLGVADACEAVGIALYGLARFTTLEATNRTNDSQRRTAST